MNSSSTVESESSFASGINRSESLPEQIPALRGFIEYVQSPDFHNLIISNSTNDLVLSFMRGEADKTCLDLSPQDIANYEAALTHLNESQSERPDKIKLGSKWARAEIGELDHSAPVGRVYLNFDPKRVENLYKNIVKLASIDDVGLSVRLPTTIDQRLVQRTDKMCLFFGEPDSKKVLNIIQELSGADELATLDGIPFGTKQLCDSDGNPMPGVSFSVENSGDTPSFFASRCAALTDIVMGATDNNATLAEWHNTCSRNDINPDIIAFNASTPPDQFVCFR